jgi:ketosteroid isomerase-like protein
MVPHDERAVVMQTLRGYYAASNKDDLPGMVSYVHEPVTFITAAGVRSFAARADVTPFLAQFFARLRAMGAVRTEWTESHIEVLSDTLAVADLGLVRFATDGREVERLAFMYLLHKTASGWKIAVLASHPAETVLPVDR